MGSTICTAGFPSAAIASSCFTARCDSIWYGFFIATLLFLGKRNCSQPIKGFERGSRYFLRSTGHSRCPRQWCGQTGQLLRLYLGQRRNLLHHLQCCEKRYDRRGIQAVGPACRDALGVRCIIHGNRCPPARFDEPAGSSISIPTRTNPTKPSLPCRWPERKPWSKVTWTASDSGCSPAVRPPRPIQPTPEIFRQITNEILCEGIYVRNHHYHYQRQRSAKVSVHPPRGHRRGIRHHRREPGLHDRPEVLRRQESRKRGSPGEGAGAPARVRSSRSWPVHRL